MRARGRDDFVFKNDFARARGVGSLVARGVVRRFGRPPRATAEALADMRRRNTRNVSDDDVSFLEEADALHAFASTLGRVGRRRRRVASLSALSRPTGRSRVERRDVDVRFRFPVIDDGAFSVTSRPSSPVLEITFSAPERGEGGDAFRRNKNDVEKIEAEAEAEKP